MLLSAPPSRAGAPAQEAEGDVVIWGLGTCDACRRALREARATGADAVLRDVRAERMSEALRARAAAAFGDALVNRRSATWRGLNDAARAMPPAALIGAHPAVMKRPLIEAHGALHLGWDEAVRRAVLPD